MTDIKVKISIGELVDKITILEIKLKKIGDPDSLKYIETELFELNSVYTEFYDLPIDIFFDLKRVNMKLWEIEDKIRIKESRQEFDDEFIQLARDVYFNNDIRSKIKKDINEFFNSDFQEVKQYVDYKQKEA
jgi:hypothetical protein